MPNTKRDKQAFRDAIIELATGEVLSDKNAILGLTKQGLIYPKPTAADKRYVANLMTELRNAGKIQTRQLQREGRKQAIYLFTERMHPVGVRQVAYHLSSKGLIEKKEQIFQQVSAIIGEMRESGELPWEWVVENTALHTCNTLSRQQTALSRSNAKGSHGYPKM